jgi:hypothetical protein
MTSQHSIDFILRDVQCGQLERQKSAQLKGGPASGRPAVDNVILANFHAFDDPLCPICSRLIIDRIGGVPESDRFDLRQKFFRILRRKLARCIGY